MPEFVYLPEGISITTAWVMVIATGLTSCLGGMFGAGGGTILLGLLAVLIPPMALVPVHGVVQLGATGFRSLLLLKHIQLSMLAPFILGTSIGSALSGLMFVQLPSWLIQYAIAGFILWSISGIVPTVGRNGIVAAGIFSGFLTMLFGATGTFVSAFIKTMRLPALNHLATQSAMMALQHSLKLLMFGVLGFAFLPYAFLLSMMLISGMIGTSIGRHLLRRIDEDLFRRILNVILGLLALRLIWLATEEFANI